MQMTRHDDWPRAGSSRRDVPAAGRVANTDRVSTTVHFVDPRAQGGPVAEPYDLAWDPSRGAPPVVGILVNAFFDSEPFAEALGAALARRLPGTGVRLWNKGDPSTPAPAELVAEVAEASSVCIALIGHCGSCTGGTVRDAVNLARAGTPAVGLATELFAEHAAFIATAAGMPGVPLVILPHPVAGTGTEGFETIAEGAADEILSALGAGVAVGA
jgi:hypothetical protein